MSIEEIKQVAGNVEAPPEVVPTPVDQTPSVNIPLTDEQKLILRTYQSRLAILAKQKSEIDVQVAKLEGRYRSEHISHPAVWSGLDAVPRYPGPECREDGGSCKTG